MLENIFEPYAIIGAYISVYDNNVQNTLTKMKKEYKDIVDKDTGVDRDIGIDNTTML